MVINKKILVVFGVFFLNLGFTWTSHAAEKKFDEKLPVYSKLSVLQIDKDILDPVRTQLEKEGIPSAQFLTYNPDFSKVKELIKGIFEPNFLSNEFFEKNLYRYQPNLSFTFKIESRAVPVKEYIPTLSTTSSLEDERAKSFFPKTQSSIDRPCAYMCTTVTTIEDN